MKLGVNIGYWGLGPPSADQLEIVQEAERIGYDSVWAAEAYGSDAATVLAWLAGQTSRIKIGSAIFQMPARSRGDDRDDGGDARPALRRADAARHRLVRPAGRRGLARAALRQAARRARASTSPSCAWRSRASGWSTRARRSMLPLPDGPGKALKLTIAPVQERIPIYSPRSARRTRRSPARSPTAGSRCCFSPEHLPAAAHAARGGRREGRPEPRRLRHRPDAST